MVRCLHCNHVVWVKDDKLPEHIKRVHIAKLLPKLEPEPQPPGRQIHYLYANPGKIKISSTGKSRPTPNLAPEPEGEQYLDGSANSHIRRDQGRFGSHPSFDAMDDDSNPKAALSSALYPEQLTTG